MKNLLWFIVLTTILGSFIYLYVEDKVENEKILAELKIELKEIGDGEIPQVADNVIVNLNKEKKEKKVLLDSLDLIIENKNKRLKSSNKKLKENEEKIIFLELERRRVDEEKEELNRMLEKNDSTLVEIENSVNKLTEIYEKITQEKVVLEKKYTELLLKYDGSKFILVDSIYQIDTIFYKPKDVKKIKLRN